MNWAFSLTLPFLAICSWSGGNPSPLEGSYKTPQKQERTAPSFRYVIVFNDVVDAVHEVDPNRTGPKQRFVDVLIDKEAFTEENLKLLYQSLSNRFPDPQLLSVSVATSLSDIETPEEHEGPHSSEPEGPAPRQREGSPSSTRQTPSAIGNPHAIFIRTAVTEFIRYWYPTPKGEKQDEIVLRGADPEKTKPANEPKN
jgi:hypothetical protein